MLRLPGEAGESDQASLFPTRELSSPQGQKTMALQLLRRWGIVFRDLLARERLAPAWRDLLLVYRTMEACGEIRGGRFVSGFSGEQFALPEAIQALRRIRRQELSGEEISVSSADPVNLVGIVLPGPKIRPVSEEVLWFRDGELVDPSEQKWQGLVPDPSQN